MDGVALKCLLDNVKKFYDFEAIFINLGHLRRFIFLMFTFCFCYLVAFLIELFVTCINIICPCYNYYVICTVFPICYIWFY